MAKTIDKKLSEERENRKLIEKIAKRFSKPPKDLSSREVYDKFCIQYGEAIAPELRRIDQWQARSYGHMFTKAVRGSCYNN